MSSEQAPHAVPQRGELWWLKVNPANAKDPHLPRPVLILSPTGRNKHWDTVIGVPLSHGISNINPKFHKRIAQGHAGCPKESYARCELVSTIDKQVLDLHLGSLGGIVSDKLLWEVVRGVRAAIGDNPDL
jgi:mRNA-degrading endonuclease toxin of MazEF toxin-antitoxin module